MGTVALTNRFDDVSGNKRVVEATLALSASYATGGDTLSPATLGLKQVTSAEVLSGPVASYKDRRGALLPAVATSARNLRVAGTPGAVLVQAYSGTTEVVAATDLSNQTYRVRFHGV